MPTTESTLLAPVVETVGTFSSGTLSLRIYRVPSSQVAGYHIYRSESRTGFAGKLGSGEDFELLATTVTQPSTTTIYTDQQLTGQPTDSDIYYRVQAVDHLTTPTLLSHLSNVATFRYLSDRTVPVPTLPSTLRPGVGRLSGIIDTLLDSDDTTGALTWHEFMTRCARVSEGVILERLLGQFPIGDALEFFRDPPKQLVEWYENRVVWECLPDTTLPHSEIEEKLGTYEQRADKAMSELFDTGTINFPGSPSQREFGGMKVR